MGDEFYLGQIILFAGTFAPVGWYPCDGRLLVISEHDALYALLGTTYGGDGVTTFALPDLRGRAPVSVGQGPGLPGYVLGQVAGHESVTLTTAEMPVHTHAVEAKFVLHASASAADASSPKDGVLAAPAASAIYVSAPDASTTLSSRAVTMEVSAGAAGASLPVPTMMPYTAITYCICYKGIVPPPPE